ncbi:MAG: ATP-binding cassette domain-containing protein [candidate division WWE3 bacterium]|nr:ATP-binding cassette domain-containing protein [candidate division WWE3 bacterium]
MEREVTSQPKEEYVSKKIKGLNFATDIRPGKLMVRCSNVAKAYGKNRVFTNLDFELRGQEKLWLFGPNGAGKSTLVKMIMGEELTSSGEVKIGDNVKLGYFAQVQHMDKEGTDNRNLQEIFTASTNCFFYDAKGYLSKFLFNKDDIAKRIWQLSPGERARFAFAIFAHKDYDLLILDEPDNHLDIETKEVIEDSLRKYQGTLLLVSHDRYFVESVGVNKVLNLKAGALSYFENESLE